MTDSPPLEPNPGKSLTLEVRGTNYARFPIRTHVVTSEDSPVALARKYAAPHLRPGDVLCMSEKVVSITQGRAYRIVDIRPGFMARLLYRAVTKTPYGIGLGSPETMQLAIQEVGLPRILCAAAAAAVTKPFGIRGVFYRIAGRQAASIDGPTPYTLPPYNQYASLGPVRPDETAREMSALLGAPVAIIDANDLGVEVLGASEQVDRELIRAVFKDNPLGQGSQQTPIAIVRRWDQPH